MEHMFIKSAIKPIKFPHFFLEGSSDGKIYANKYLEGKKAIAIYSTFKDGAFCILKSLEDHLDFIRSSGYGIVCLTENLEALKKETGSVPKVPVFIDNEGKILHRVGLRNAFHFKKVQAAALILDERMMFHYLIEARPKALAKYVLKFIQTTKWVDSLTIEVPTETFNQLLRSQSQLECASSDSTPPEPMITDSSDVATEAMSIDDVKDYGTVKQFRLFI